MIICYAVNVNEQICGDNTSQYWSHVQMAYLQSLPFPGSNKGSQLGLFLKLIRPSTSPYKHLSPSGSRRTVQHAFIKGYHIGYPSS